MTESVQPAMPALGAHTDPVTSERLQTAAQQVFDGMADIAAAFGEANPELARQMVALMQSGRMTLTLEASLPDGALVLTAIGDSGIRIPLVEAPGGAQFIN